MECAFQGQDFVERRVGKLHCGRGTESNVDLFLQPALGDAFPALLDVDGCDVDARDVRHLEAIEKNKVLLRETDADVEDSIAWLQPRTRSQEFDHRDTSVGIGASDFPVTEVEPQRLGVIDVPFIHEDR